MMRKYICGLCDEEFPSIESCQGHVIISHQNIADPDEADESPSNYTNEKSNEEENDRDSLDGNDRDTQNGGNKEMSLSFQCALCGDECESYDSMIRHIRSTCKQFKFTLNQMDKTGSFMHAENIFCGFCSSSFSSIDKHLMHIIEEYCIVGGRLQKCPRCPKSFPYYPSFHYKKHMKYAHQMTGIDFSRSTVFACSNCNFCGKNPLELIDHITTHKCTRTSRIHMLTPRQMEYIQFQSKSPQNPVVEKAMMNKYKKRFWNEYRQLDTDPKQMSDVQGYDFSRNLKDMVSGSVRYERPDRNPERSEMSYDLPTEETSLDTFYDGVPLPSPKCEPASEDDTGEEMQKSENTKSDTQSEPEIHLVSAKTCYSCHKLFESSAVLRAHLQMSHMVHNIFVGSFLLKCLPIVTTPTPIFDLCFFQCPFCATKMKSHSRFIVHLNSEKRLRAEIHKKGVPTCPMCSTNRGYPSVARVLEHCIKTHCKINRDLNQEITNSNESAFEQVMKCSLYGCTSGSFYNQASFDDHLRYVHLAIEGQTDRRSNLVYRCHQCGRMLGSVLKLVEHLITVNPKTGLGYCPRTLQRNIESGLDEVQSNTVVTIDKESGQPIWPNTSQCEDQARTSPTTVDMDSHQVKRDEGGSEGFTFVSSLCSSDDEADQLDDVVAKDTASAEDQTGTAFLFRSEI